jgi:hypothetical protein
MSLNETEKLQEKENEIEIVAHPCNEHIEVLINTLFDAPRNAREPWTLLRECFRQYGLFPSREHWVPQPNKVRRKRSSTRPADVSPELEDERSGRTSKTN